MKTETKNIENKTKEKIFLENLRDTKEIFNKLGIKFWLDWGTLLGAVREGKIIEWDHDVDLGLMAEDFEKNASVFSEMKKKGFFLKEPVISEPKLFVLNFWRSGYNVGIWPYYGLDKNKLKVFHYYSVSKNLIAHFLWYLWCSLECRRGIYVPINKFKLIVATSIKIFTHLLPEKIKPPLIKIIKKIFVKKNYFKPLEIIVPQHYFENFKTIKFYDMEFEIPFNSEGYLEYKYGPDWRVPKKKWDWVKEDRSVVKKTKIVR